MRSWLIGTRCIVRKVGRFKGVTISPLNGGTIYEGELFTLEGFGDLSDVVSVKINDVHCTNVTLLSSTSISAVAPSDGVLYANDVTIAFVRTSDYDSYITSSSGYLYESANYIVYNYGDLTGITSVTIDGVESTNVIVHPDGTYLTATAPSDGVLYSNNVTVVLS